MDPNWINLAKAETHLIRNLEAETARKAIAKSLQSEHLNWPKGFWGDPELLALLAYLFNTRFDPHSAIESKHLAVIPGAAACLDNLLCTLCNAGDEVLVSTPYWSGYGAFSASHFGVTPQAVDVPDFKDPLGPALIDALDAAMQNTKQTVRALMLANLHNPLGRCYSGNVLKHCIRFCEEHDIHLVSDGVFALSKFECPDLVGASAFTSVLSIDMKALGANEKRVHVKRGLSKDIATSGVRLVSAAFLYWSF